MKIMLVVVAAVLLNIGIASSQRGDDYKDKVVAEVGKEKITFGEIEHAFKKNMSRKNVNLYDIPMDSIKNFINLYINYRLKVQDAVNRGFHNDSAIKAEISQNRKLIAESFYYEKEMAKPRIEKLLSMRETEYKVAVIIIEAPDADTLTAYNKALEALNKIKAGEPFDKIAREYSSERESAEKGGVIERYITSGSVQQPIEKAVYATKLNQVYPEVIKTRGAYFIVKVIDVAPRKFRLGSHILVSIKDTDTTLPKSKIDSIYNLLLKGGDFKRIAEDASDDNATSMYGGSLGDYYSRSTGFFKTGSPLLTDFEKTLFSLNPGEYSKPVRTEYGYHIVKLDSLKGMDIEAERAAMERLYNKIYLDDDKRAHNDSLRKAFGLKINQATLDKLLSKLDTTKTTITDNWDEKVDSKLGKETLYEVLKTKKTVTDFVAHVKKENKFKGMPLNSRGITNTIYQIADPEIFAAASANLEEKYPDFKLIMKEFHDGILLFKVAEIEVWKKLKFDSVEARKYWEPIKSSFKTSPKYDISEIFVLNDSVAKSLAERIKKGENFDTLAAQFTQRSGYRERNGKWGPLQADKSELAKRAQEEKASKGAIIGPFKYERGYSIIRVNDFLPVREKTFEEAIPDFAPEYQDLAQKKLEDNWINNLKKNITVTVHNNVVQEIVNRMHN